MPRPKSNAIWPPAPPENESDVDKAARLQQELDAKRVSDAIDQTLSAEREQRKRSSSVKILLLGQAESGKSTVLKNFQLHFSPKAFRAEAEIWRPVIHLNLIRSVNFIVNFLAGRNSNPPEATSSMSITNDLRTLCARLAPLRQVEETLTTRLSGTSVVEGPETFQYHPAKASEISIRSGSGWKGLMNFRRQSFSSVKTDDTQNRRILNALAEDIAMLWEEPMVQRELKDRDIVLQDQPGFFLNDVKRIAAEDYKPTPDDILRARVQTIGPEEHKIITECASDKAREWKIYDVGGSRSQRAAWAQFFDDVNVIIFLAPMSAFNQTLAEDETVNRLTDSLKLWQTICGNKLLAGVELILFLNKLDILDAKLKAGVQFADYVTSYKPRVNATKPVAKYLLDVFVTLHQQHSPKKRKIHPHLTCAIDTRATASVINQIQEVILVRILSQTNIL